MSLRTKSPAFVLTPSMTTALWHKPCRGLSTGEIDKDNAATKQSALLFRAALTNKGVALPFPHLSPKPHYHHHQHPPPRFCVAPPQSLSSLLLFSHHLCLIAFPSTCIRSIIHDLLLSAVPFLRLDHLIPCTSLSSPCTLLCPEVFPDGNESGRISTPTSRCISASETRRRDVNIA